MLETIRQNPILNIIRVVIIRAIDFFALIIILFFVSVIIYTTHFTNNLVYDLFESKTSGPIFNGTHPISAVIIFVTFLYLWFKDNKMDFQHIALWVFSVTGTVGIHELYFVIQGTSFLSVLGISYQYEIQMLILAAFPIIFFRKYIKKVLLYQMCIVSGISLIGIGIGFHATQINGSIFSQYDTLANNVFEIISWVIPLSLWYVPKQWFVKTK